ncbi:hypothetical protein Holit_02614 [Hollandina sp. SP2]
MDIVEAVSKHEVLKLPQFIIIEQRAYKGALLQISRSRFKKIGLYGHVIVVF